MSVSRVHPHILWALALLDVDLALATVLVYLLTVTGGL